MIALAPYLLKLIICSGVLTGYYYLALRNKVFHQWNRFYLLLVVVLSIVLPLCSFDLFYNAAEDPAKAVRLLQVMSATDDYVVRFSDEGASAFNWQNLSFYGYALISFFLLSAMAFTFLRLRAIIKSHKVQELDGIMFLNTEVKGTPFSFFNYLFWNSAIDINTPEGQQIFRHELTHVRERHTWDKLFIQIVLIGAWCNPFFWIIRSELRIIHEFIADKKSVDQQDATSLAALMLQSIYPTHYSNLINPFFHQSVKRRLLMLTKMQNPRVNYLSRILILPIVALIAVAFTLKPKEKQTIGALEKEGIENYLVAIKNKTGIISNPATIRNSIRDTTPVKKIRTEDIAEMNVLSDKQIELKLKDGSVHKLTLAQLKEQGLLNDGYGTKKTLEVEKKAALNYANTGSIRVTGIDTSKKPLLIINGEIYPYDAINELDPNSIEHVNVLKDASAVTKWGNKALNGAIEIKLKAGIATPDKKQSYKKVPFNEVEFGGDSLIVNKGDLTIKGGVISIQSPQPSKGSSEPTFTKAEVPPIFPGGTGAWRKFLEKNLQVNIPEKNGAPKGMYAATAQFIVEKDGTLSNIEALTSHGYGMEEEVLRILKTGPKWVAAIQNGKTVRAYHKQNITFVITE